MLNILRFCWWRPWACSNDRYRHQMEVYQPLQGRDCRLEKLQGLAVPYLNM